MDGSGVDFGRIPRFPFGPRSKTRVKILRKTGPDPESLFNFGSRRSLRGHFLSKNMGKFGWIDGSRCLNRSRIKRNF